MLHIVTVINKEVLYKKLATSGFSMIREWGIMLWEACSYEIVYESIVVVKSKLKHVIVISTMYRANEQIKKKK